MSSSSKTHGKKSSANERSGSENNKTKVELAGSVMEKTTINAPNDFRTYADSGATTHCFFNEEAFIPGTLVPCDEHTVVFGDKTSANANLWGQVLIPFDEVNITLYNVSYVPSIGYNLVSTGRLEHNGIESLFGRNDFLLKLESDHSIIGQRIRDDRVQVVCVVKRYTCQHSK